MRNEINFLAKMFKGNDDTVYNKLDALRTEFHEAYLEESKEKPLKIQ